MNCLVLISGILLAVVNCEKFSAISEMEQLVSDEELIVTEFERFVGEMQREMEYLMSKLSDWREQNALAKRDTIGYITNPINAFLMIKRTTADVDLIESRLAATFERFKEKIKEAQPTSEDLSGAVEGLLRLQTIFKLQSKDIGNGVIDGEKVSEKMKPHDLYTVAVQAMQLGKHNFFVDEYIWELRKSLRTNGDEFGEVDVRQVNKLAIDNDNTTKVNPYAQNYTKNGVYAIEKEQILYSQLCRREAVKTAKESAALRCRYLSTSPFSSIAPYKVEEADHHSSLVIFHDIISDSEIEALKTIARTKLYRGRVIQANNENHKSSYRVAKIAWIKDHESDIASRITKRVEDMTRLSMKTSEELQVQNYGIGGHYNPHWDIRIKRDGSYPWKTGNRIATVLFYLSTVERGGATVFPLLKVHVPAVKGTAAFWYNLRDSGDDDYYTRHAACPVLIGSKWVANKWIHEHEQEFRRPCTPGDYVETSEETTLSNFF